MTPDLTADSPGEAPKQAPSTAGMTTKVVKGSMWTLIGSVAPLAVSFIATPFIIRLLGTESYGVLLLVGLIPTYFAFADFGMGVASTKFASEAYGQGDADRERAVVRIAATFCLGFSAAILLPVFIFAGQLVPLFSVPADLESEAVLALRISTVSFVLALLSSVFNAPQLARLRMDLNSLANGAPKIAMALLTPLVLYIGGGIVEAVWLGLLAAVASIVLNLVFSARLLPALWRSTLQPGLAAALIRFGGGWFFASLATTLLANMEKLLLARMVSVSALAYYSVAFAFAGMVTIFSIALRQSLLPAFSQLSHPEKTESFLLLVQRCVRLIFLVLIPGLVLLCVIARPFFTLWAGPEFGDESSVPFYILTIGLFFSLIGYIPHSVIMARGRTDVFARLYWVELLAYAVLAAVLTYNFGIVGAAAAWALRVCADSIAIVFIAKRIFPISFGFAANSKILGWSALVMAPLVLLAAMDNFSPVLIPAGAACLTVYFFIVWRSLLDDVEKAWLKERLRPVL